MRMDQTYDAVVVGSGPNGFAAGITLAEQGFSVLIIEGSSATGGGVRSAELTLPDVLHDVCSSAFPMALASGFFRKLPLETLGVKWIHAPIAMAHPLDNDVCSVLGSLDETAASLGGDGRQYREIMGPLIENFERLIPDLLAPLRFTLTPRSIRLFSLFGRYGLRSGTGFIKRFLKSEQGRALFLGAANHASAPLNSPFSAAIGLALLLCGHYHGWPFVEGGAGNLSKALRAYFSSRGGKVLTAHPVSSLDDLPLSERIFFDITPRQLLNLAGKRLSPLYRYQLRKFRYGLGVYKIDWTLNEPVPFRSPVCRKAGTVHVGGGAGEILEAEAQAWNGQAPEKPFVLLVQPGAFDPARTKAGHYPVWGYCHVPLDSGVDMTERIEAQVERFAPGFRDCILKRHILSPADLQRYNPNYVGGNIMGGLQDWRQFFTRPFFRFGSPYRIPLKGKKAFLCSASTPPGGGVHGMCGVHAALSALAQND